MSTNFHFHFKGKKESKDEQMERMVHNWHANESFQSRERENENINLVERKMFEKKIQWFKKQFQEDKAEKIRDMIEQNIQWDNLKFENGRKEYHYILPYEDFEMRKFENEKTSQFEFYFSQELTYTAVATSNGKWEILTKEGDIPVYSVYKYIEKAVQHFSEPKDRYEAVCKACNHVMKFEIEEKQECGWCGGWSFDIQEPRIKAPRKMVSIEKPFSTANLEKPFSKEELKEESLFSKDRNEWIQSIEFLAEKLTEGKDNLHVIDQCQVEEILEKYHSILSYSEKEDALIDTEKEETIRVLKETMIALGNYEKRMEQKKREEYEYKIKELKGIIKTYTPFGSD